ncbi:hypothetical protein D3C81_1674220 [compost metagenome]
MQRHFLRHLTDLGKFVEEFWKHQILEDIDGALALLAQIHRDLEGREFVSSLRLQLQQLDLQRFQFRLHAWNRTKLPYGILRPAGSCHEAVDAFPHPERLLNRL